MSMYLESYGEKLFLIKGKDSYIHKDSIKNLGAKWQPDLKAWSFPKSLKEKFDDFIEENGGESKAVKSSSKTTTPVITNNNSKDFVSKKDFLTALSRIERLETLLGQIIGVDKKIDIPKVFEVKKQKENSVIKEVKENKKEEKKENRNYEIKKVVDDEDDKNEEQEDDKPKRLLRKKKT